MTSSQTTPSLRSLRKFVRVSRLYFRTASLLKIFLAFVTHSLVTQIESDLGPSDLIYDSGKSIRLTFPRIYKMLAIWIRIYGEQHKPFGVKRGERPLRYQPEQYCWEYAVFS